MKTRTLAGSRLITLAVLVTLALALLGGLAAGLLVQQLLPFPGTAVRSLHPVASLTCQKYARTNGRPGSYCAWYMGADTVLVSQAPPEQVIAAYAPRHWVARAGQVQFAIGAQTTEDANPQTPPLFPVYFGFSVFLEDLP